MTYDRLLDPGVEKSLHVRLFYSLFPHNSNSLSLSRTSRDYRGIKKRITAIRNAQQGTSFHVSNDDDPSDDIQSLPDAPRPSDVDSEGLRRSEDLSFRNIPSHGRDHPGDVQSQASGAQSVAASRPGRGTHASTSFKATRGKSSTTMSASSPIPRLWY